MTFASEGASRSKAVQTDLEALVEVEECVRHIVSGDAADQQVPRDLSSAEEKADNPLRAGESARDAEDSSAKLDADELPEGLGAHDELRTNGRTNESNPSVSTRQRGANGQRSSEW